jgi:hypothetical protein
MVLQYAPAENGKTPGRTGASQGVIRRASRSGAVQMLLLEKDSFHVVLAAPNFWIRYADA